jgi:hypothetical protein
MVLFDFCSGDEAPLSPQFFLVYLTAALIQVSLRFKSITTSKVFMEVLVCDSGWSSSLHCPRDDQLVLDPEDWPRHFYHSLLDGSWWLDRNGSSLLGLPNHLHQGNLNLAAARRRRSVKAENGDSWRLWGSLVEAQYHTLVLISNFNTPLLSFSFNAPVLILYFLCLRFYLLLVVVKLAVCVVEYLETNGLGSCSTVICDTCLGQVKVNFGLFLN